VKTKLILIGVGAALVITGLWFFALWSPQGKNLEEARAEEQAAEQRAAELSSKLAHLKKLEANAAVLERDRAMLAAAVPATDQLDQFILQVNDRAAKSGVTFVSVAPQAPGAAGSAPTAATAGAPTPIGLQLQVQGDYFAIMRFMEQLRDGERLVTVENFSLSKGGEGPGGMTASITGRMFMSPAAASAAPTTASA